MRHEGSRAWKALERGLRQRTDARRELADTALVLVGGVLLMLPGFVTDMVGFFFLLPFTRPLARKLLTFLVSRRLSRLGVVGGLSVRRTEPSSQVKPSRVKPCRINRQGLDRS